jgi:predicted Zn-dependent peptidase
MRSESGCCAGAQGSAGKPEAASSALELLAERFARGEIDKAEFEERRQIIAGPRQESTSGTSSTKGCC